ncbi:hypothetical protein [Lacticaseibacillus saniviri]|nr:hypothetical protein [Lacticaseibacillus saniviri]MCG4281955.1 hypothetical protein [Lacticaseibacillus saniviri]
MAGKLSKEERKAMAKKAEADAAKHPKKTGMSGFATIDAEADRLEKEN